MEWWFLCASPFQMWLLMRVLVSIPQIVWCMYEVKKNWLVYCSLSLSQSIYIHRSLDQEDPYLNLIYNTRSQSLSLTLWLDKTFEGFWNGVGVSVILHEGEICVIMAKGPLWPGIVCSMSPKESYTTLWRPHNAKHWHALPPVLFSVANADTNRMLILYFKCLLLLI